MAETLFNLLNLLPLPIWLSMILFPRTRFTQQLVLAFWPYMVLGGIYLLFLLASLLSGSNFSLSFNSLRNALSGEWAFMAVWAHFVTLDLFTGVWIFRDAKYWGINPTLFLVLTLFVGPLGLASYLLMRRRKTNHDPIKTLN
jgi:hypothetical protein